MSYKLQSKNKKNNNLMLVLLVVLILAIIGVIFYSYWQRSYGEIDPWLKSDLPPVKVSRIQNFDQAEEKIFSSLMEMFKSGRYGLWPISQVLLSQNRGNPFIIKTNTP